MSTIRQEDFEAMVGRAEGGDFMQIIHQPTGTARRRGPPLGAPEKAREEMLREIEAELRASGWSQLPKNEKA